MAVYVDQAAILYKGKPRHHMTADSIEELHSFADRADINRCWYHRGARHPHYDITDEQRHTALQAGAVAVSSRELMIVARRLNSASLRRGLVRLVEK